MLNRLLAADAVWNWFALEVALKGTLLLLLAACLVMMLHRSSAAVRHRVWALTFAGLLLLPLMQLLGPGLPWKVIPENWQALAIDEPPPLLDATLSGPAAPSRIRRTSQAEAATVVATGEPSDTPNRKLVSAEFDEPPPVSNVAAVASSPPSQTGDETAQESSLPWLPLVWLIGIVVALVPLLTGLVGNIRLRFCSPRFVDAEWQQFVAALSERLSLQRTVTLLEGGPYQMPMTFGLVRPRVVLPSTAQHWSAERRAIVLLHELAHVKRCDVPLQLIARLAAAMYWFHPLVWWALRQMRLEREHACDDCVLQAGQEAPDYATQLLEIARAHRSRMPLLNAALSMARPSQLEGRLLAVLDTHRRRNGISRAAAIQLTAATVALVACIGLVRPMLHAEPTASANDDNAAATQDSSKPATQMVLTGTVLSPQGKPVPAATVEVIAYDGSTWPRGIGEKKIDYYQTRSAADGQFRIALPRDILRPREFTQIIASAEGYALNQQMIESTLARSHVQIKLHEPRVVRLQLIDNAGNPIANVQPQLRRVSWKENSLGFGHRNGPRAVSAWPQVSRSDAQGYASVTVPTETKSLLLLVEDNEIGGHMLRVDVSDNPTNVVLKPAQFVNGKVTGADTGKPVAGAEVVLMEEPYRRTVTGSDGTFRIASNARHPEGESTIHVYPPRESPYLFHALVWKWPDGGFGDAELSVALERGIVVEGQVVERGTGKPVEDATLYFSPQEENNPFYRESANVIWNGSDMKYRTDAEGRFRMPVWPGPGYLIVRGPTLDFAHVQVSWGDLHYGKPGLKREYHHGALRINLEPGQTPESLKIELERGVTLRRKVVRPDGQAAVGKAYTRTYTQKLNGYGPYVPIEGGVLELPGFDTDRSKPIFFVDPEARCAAVVAPTASQVDLSDPPIKLQPCGAAKFRFVNDQGKPLTDYEPHLLLIQTPGAPATGFIVPDQPLWADSLYWPTLVHPLEIPKTDADGRVTVDKLIPGGTYRVSFTARDGLWTDGYEFIVRSGETVDVGEVVIPERD